MHETEGKTQEYARMLFENKETTNSISFATANISRCKIKTQRLALKSAQVARENTDRNDALKREKNTIIKHYHDLKKKMAKLRGQKEEHLGTLVTNSLTCM